MLKCNKEKKGERNQLTGENAHTEVEEHKLLLLALYLMVFFSFLFSSSSCRITYTSTLFSLFIYYT
jgi:hypothetical protein